MKVVTTLPLALSLAVFWSLPLSAVAGDPSSLSYELKSYPSPGESPGVPTLNPTPKDPETAAPERPPVAPQEQEAEPPPATSPQDGTPADLAPVDQPPLEPPPPEQPPLEQAPPEQPQADQGTP